MTLEARGTRERGVVDADEPQLTDEGVERLRARIGIPTPAPAPPHYREPGLDAFRHVAEAYGDDNPLWSDPTHAAASRWGEPIAPPVLVGGDTLIGEDDTPEVTPDQRDLLKGDPLRGVHAYYSASAREWWAPLRAGRRVRMRNALVGVDDKRSDFAGRAVHEWTGQVFQEVGGPLLAAQYRLMIRVERSKTRSRARDEAVGPEPYTDDDLARIDEAYATEPERRRGAEPRWWDDVEVGDELGPLVKGPLTVTDMVCWHVGMGMGMYGVRALRLGYQNRQRIPRFYHRNELNVPDVLQRLHWEPETARKAGNPTTFDYGRMRETWLVHLCTDWMGDDAWLASLACQFRRFNYVGDTHWMRGRVVGKRLVDGDRPAVDVEVWGENQRGEVTTPGAATILLPSREHGPVRLPEPPGGARDLEGALDAICERFATEPPTVPEVTT